MGCEGYTQVWDLGAGELLKLDDARGTTLRVTRGTLWLTQAKDTRDFVLTAGDVYTIDRGGLTLVEAQSRASVCVLTHHVGAIRKTNGIRPLGERFHEWVESVASASLARRPWVPRL